MKKIIILILFFISVIHPATRQYISTSTNGTNIFRGMLSNSLDIISNVIVMESDYSSLSATASNALKVFNQTSNIIFNRSNHYGFILTNEVYNLSNYILFYVNDSAATLLVSMTNFDKILSNNLASDIISATNGLNPYRISHPSQAISSSVSLSVGSIPII